MEIRIRASAAAAGDFLLALWCTQLIFGQQPSGGEDGRAG